MTRVTGEWLTHPGTQTVLAVLTNGGHRAFLVGGCVRNALIGAPVGDIDISTNATPDRVTELAESDGLRVVPTGIDHGTVTVIAHGQPHEVTTFRRDVETDGRRAVVRFSDHIEDDARRRDFTMNALYADASGQVADPLNGLADLLARKVRFIDDPAARITEDHLRILRFFRFHAWYGDPAQGIDAEGLAACAALADGIDLLSRERIGAEMLKLLAAPDPAPAVAAMTQAGVLARVLPGADPVTLAPLVHLENHRIADPIRRLAALGGVDVDERLRLSRKDSARLKILRDGIGDMMRPAELGWRHGAQTAIDILLLRAAMLDRPISTADLSDIAAGAAAIFPVSAADLMPGLTGPALGAELKRLERRWIDARFALSRDDLLNAP